MEAKQTELLDSIYSLVIELAKPLFDKTIVLSNHLKGVYEGIRKSKARSVVEKRVIEVYEEQVGSYDQSLFSAALLFVLNDNEYICSLFESEQYNLKKTVKQSTTPVDSQDKDTHEKLKEINYYKRLNGGLKSTLQRKERIMVEKGLNNDLIEILFSEMMRKGDKSIDFEKVRMKIKVLKIKELNVKLKEMLVKGLVQGLGGEDELCLTSFDKRSIQRLIEFGNKHRKHIKEYIKGMQKHTSQEHDLKVSDEELKNSELYKLIEVLKSEKKEIDTDSAKKQLEHYINDKLTKKLNKLVKENLNTIITDIISKEYGANKYIIFKV